MDSVADAGGPASEEKVDWKQVFHTNSNDKGKGKEPSKKQKKAPSGKKVKKADLFGSSSASDAEVDPDEMESSDNASDQASSDVTDSDDDAGSEPPLVSDDEDEDDDYVERPKKKETPILDKIEEARRDFDRALERVKGPNRRSSMFDGASEVVDLDDMAQAIRIQMDRAMDQDLQCLEEGVAAMNRLKLLPWLRDQLGKKHLHEVILDNGCLESIRRWLEPLPNRQMPTPNIRQALLECLANLPIGTEHLRESHLGPIILFQAQRSGELPEIKRLANQLVMDWSRPIVEAANNRRLDATMDGSTRSHRQAPKQLQSEAFKQRTPTAAKDLPSHRKISAHLQKKSRKK